MARITVEDCLKVIGNENRFTLVHLAVKRVKQHRDGHGFLVKCKNKETVATLREIAGGFISKDNINQFKSKPAPAHTRRVAPVETEAIITEID